MPHQYVVRIFPTELHPRRPRNTAPSHSNERRGAAGDQRNEGEEIPERRSRQIPSRQTQRPVPQSEEA
jgi:hypothetical protein